MVINDCFSFLDLIRCFGNQLLLIAVVVSIIFQIKSGYREKFLVFPKLHSQDYFFSYKLLATFFWTLDLLFKHWVQLFQIKSGYREKYLFFTQNSSPHECKQGLPIPRLKY